MVGLGNPENRKYIGYRRAFVQLESGQSHVWYVCLGAVKGAAVKTRSAHDKCILLIGYSDFGGLINWP